MINSDFVLKIITEILDSDDSRKWLNHLPDLVVNNLDYTGSGVFISFQKNESGITDPGTNLVFDGLFIESPELELGATATVFITNGEIDYLEIWSHSDDYPKQELKTFRLSRKWDPTKKISPTRQATWSNGLEKAMKNSFRDIEFIEKKYDDGSISLETKKASISLWVSSANSEYTIGIDSFGECTWHSHMSLHGANTLSEQTAELLRQFGDIVMNKRRIIYGDHGCCLADSEDLEIEKAKLWNEMN